MATEQAMNGTYASQTSFGTTDQTYASHNVNSPGYNNTAQHSTTQSSSSSGAADIPKDEVGWYFVEQYYTTLSRSPEKLFLFYNKRSQLVSGVEEEKVDVCVGQKAINDRIKELDYKDCKVRVTNVDSQGSDSNIVIQVIGEISNKNQPHRKFSQTFVLAGQTNGYFVLNDIFRYIKEEDEELPEEELQQDPTTAVDSGFQEPEPTAQDVEDKSGSHEVVANEEEVAQVDKQLEEIAQKEEAAEQRTVSPPPAQVNGTPVPESAEVVHADEAPVAAVGGPEAPSAKEAEAALAEEAPQPEKPQDPEPSPAPEPAKVEHAPAPTSAAPAKPMSWAMKAASAHRNLAPAVPAVPAQAVPAPKAAPSTQAKSAPAPVTPAADSPAARSESPVDNQQDGWQTAGAEHSKRQSRVQNQPSGESTSVRAYIKNVYENTDADALKAALSKFDKITYFDISRPKNAAFVEFATQEGFNAAVAANPHRVGEATIYVEERRQPGGQFGRFPSRGGSISGRGRGGADSRPGQGRGGFSKDGGRGGFTPRGRGGNVTPRRGGSTAA